MKVFIVALPLFNASMTVEAYRLCDQSGEHVLSIRNDYRGITEAFQSPGLDLVEKIGVEPFAGDSLLFVEIGKLHLLMGLPAGRDIPAEKLVCLIPGAIPADDDVLERCSVLKQSGYRIALDNFPLNGVQSPFLDYADYMLLDYSNPRFTVCMKAMCAHRPSVRLVVSGVPDMPAFEQLSASPALAHSLFSGHFYRQPITKGVSKISPVKINALQLLKNVNEPDFDLSDITRIIGRDPALSISLLRFINSGALNLRNKVDSIQNAVAILGQQEVRHWATVAISVSLAEDRPGEITKLSLVRAKFAENLAGAFELGVFQSHLFMTGLFSLLDVILQKPMAEAVQEIAVDARVRSALVEHSGELYKVMELIYTYEYADWDSVSILMIRNNVSIDAVNEAFVGALVWYNQLLSIIDEDAEAPPEVSLE